jgi:hypothetical protein
MLFGERLYGILIMNGKLKIIKVTVGKSKHRKTVEKLTLR